jgi:hypothetical protein
MSLAGPGRLCTVEDLNDIPRQPAAFWTWTVVSCVAAEKQPRTEPGYACKLAREVALIRN